MMSLILDADETKALHEIIDGSLYEQWKDVREHLDGAYDLEHAVKNDPDFLADVARNNVEHIFFDYLTLAKRLEIV
jgi:hypothetical protein